MENKNGWDLNELVVGKLDKLINNVIETAKVDEDVKTIIDNYTKERLESMIIEKLEERVEDTMEEVARFEDGEFYELIEDKMKSFTKEIFTLGMIAYKSQK